MWWQMLALPVVFGSALFASGLPVQSQTALSEPLRLVGRFDVRPDQVIAEWPGSLIEIRFEGARLDVTLADSGTNSLVVEVDGVPRRLALSRGVKTYSIIDTDTAALHVVRLIKSTEAVFGRIVLRSIATDGRLLPPLDGRSRILVIGDSISTGYGVEGKTTDCGFEPDLANQYLTYAAVAARKLDADVVTLAVSGAGLVRNFNGDRRGTMGQLMHRVLPSMPAVAPLPTAETVIVHLGTNDFADGARPEGFTEAYRALLKEIRATSPTAMIYAAMGPMLRPEDQAAVITAIKQAVAARQAQGDEKVAEIQFYWPLQARDLGCDWHPSAMAHARMAEALAQRIREDRNRGPSN